MKIERSRLMTFGEFAELHDLTMVVTQVADQIFHAHLKDVRLLDAANFPSHFWGKGKTEDVAIHFYSNVISGKRVVISKDKDKTIEVPYLLPEWSSSGDMEKVRLDELFGSSPLVSPTVPMSVRIVYE